MPTIEDFAVAERLMRGAPGYSIEKLREKAEAIAGARERARTKEYFPTLKTLECLDVNDQVAEAIRRKAIAIRLLRDHQRRTLWLAQNGRSVTCTEGAVQYREPTREELAGWKRNGDRRARGAVHHFEVANRILEMAGFAALPNANPEVFPFEPIP